jgi:hypothetical protein
VAVAVFAGAGSYASAQAFVDGFAPAVGVAATMAFLGAIAALGLPGRRRVSVAVVAEVPVLEPESVG